jgi:hypothetical protein
MMDERPSEDLPPGTPDVHMMSVGAFRRRYEEQRKTYRRAATALLYQGRELPYHYDVLMTAQKLSDCRHGRRCRDHGSNSVRNRAARFD